ncbi:MAG: hypothetical protein LBC86_07845 [Oscillospiraceae bacterium]|jgi:hypothetical protein|nr:hypothetical protein [Oscillospiraceae bacterium]
MRRFITVLLTAAVVFTTSDALKILQYTAGLIQEIPASYDLNGDGIINSADALAVLRIIAGVEEAPEHIPYEPESESPARETPPPLTPLSRREELGIRENFAVYFQEYVRRIAPTEQRVYSVSDVEFTGYYGTYNGYEAVSVWVPWTNGTIGTSVETWEPEVAGYTFHLEQLIFLFKGTSVVPLKSAYRQGLIGEDDIYAIHYYITQPLRETPSHLAPLTLQAEERIIDSFINAFFTWTEDPPLFLVGGYFGTYNGYDAVQLQLLSTWRWGMGGLPPPYRTAGFTFDTGGFTYHTNNVFLFDGLSFTDLNEAFARRIVTENDVYQIHYHWENSRWRQ